MRDFVCHSVSGLSDDAPPPSQDAPASAIVSQDSHGVSGLQTRDLTWRGGRGFDGPPGRGPPGRGPAESAATVAKACVFSLHTCGGRAPTRPGPAPARLLMGRDKGEAETASAGCLHAGESRDKGEAEPASVGRLHAGEGRESESGTKARRRLRQ